MFAAAVYVLARIEGVFPKEHPACRSRVLLPWL